MNVKNLQGAEFAQCEFDGKDVDDFDGDTPNLVGTKNVNMPRNTTTPAQAQMVQQPPIDVQPTTASTVTNSNGVSTLDVVGR